MMLKRRRKNSGRQNIGTRFASHRAWVRGHVCAVAGPDCAGNIECAHIEGSGTKGIGMKASDIYTIPLCRFHHAERHRIGWRTFDARHGLDALALAKELAGASPHLQRAAREAGWQVGDDECIA
jgi:hypothetical protein